MISRITHRADFLKAAKAAYQAKPAVVVQARQRDDNETRVEADAIRTGFTATKKIGNAVSRNRAKRRLRAAAQALIPDHGRAGHDYVLIARAATLDAPWQGLLDDVKAALIRLAVKPVPRAHSDSLRKKEPPQEKTAR